MEFRNAVFVVTEEHACPIYNVGEEINIQDSTLTLESEKPLCLMLVQELLRTMTTTRSFERRFTQTGMQRAKFECGGCSGLIRFEYKKEKAFSTLQMNLLQVARQRAKMRHVEVFFDLLKNMEIFEPLQDNDLRDLSAMLKLKRYGAHKVIIQEGDRGTHLYIILSGNVVVVKEDGEVVAEMTTGQIFGEMSLLSGEPTYPSVHSASEVQVATLNAKDFKHVLNKYPILQIFFYRLLVNRAQVNSMRSGKISSGMSGDLADINAVELFQLINSGGKTGTVEFVFSSSRASVLFNEGEIVGSVYDQEEGKEAVFSLLAKVKGTFTYTTGLSDEEMKQQVLGGFMGIIMEGIRRVDEAMDEEDAG